MSSVRVDSGCISWRTPNRDGARSTHFTVSNTDYFLQYNRGLHLGCDYRLYLFTEDTLGKRLDLFVQLIIGTDVVSHCRTTYPVKAKNGELTLDILIWRGHASQLSHFIADSHQQELLFRVTVLDDGTGQRTAADKSVQTPTYLDTKIELDNLSRDFAKLLEDGGSSHPDVELVCGDSTFKAHGSLLSVRSDVFRAMLQTDMLEAKTGRVEIKDVESDIFQEFLKYVYTGRLPELDVETAMRLYEMGDRYSVSGIKERCASFLMDNLANDNACKVLSLADQHNDQEFKEGIMSYVLNHKIPLCQEYWPDFREARPQLAFEVYDRFLKLHINKLI